MKHESIADIETRAVTKFIYGNISDYPEPFLREIKEAYISGSYPNIDELARAYGVPVKNIIKLKDENKWDDLKAYIQKELDRKLTEKIITQQERVNDQHYKLWAAFDHQVYLYMREASSQHRLIAPRILDTLSRVLERAQKGRRLAAGMSSELPQSSKLEIVYHGLDSAINAMREEHKIIDIEDVSAVEGDVDLDKE